jgi:NADP-dependent 3-hydroxy acid dehydrogenase YdfG
VGIFHRLSAFVTGAGTGIGFACARRIVDEGGRVAIAGRRTDILEAAAKEIGEGAVPVSCDITSNESVVNAIAVASKENGPLRLAVNSA